MNNKNEDDYILRPDDPQICSENSHFGGFFIFMIIICSLLFFFFQ